MLCGVDVVDGIVVEFIGIGVAIDVGIGVGIGFGVFLCLFSD